MLRAALIACGLVLAVPAYAADPLTDCHELADQMGTNALNDAIAAHVLVVMAKAQIAELTKERDDLRAKLKAAEPKSGG